jgi:hypothetical protein
MKTVTISDNATQHWKPRNSCRSWQSKAAGNIAHLSRGAYRVYDCLNICEDCINGQRSRIRSVRSFRALKLAACDTICLPTSVVCFCNFRPLCPTRVKHCAIIRHRRMVQGWGEDPPQSDSDRGASSRVPRCLGNGGATK